MKHPNDNRRPNSRSGSLGQYLRSRERLVHKSADAWMQANPVSPMAPRIPMQTRPGVTYNAGRNKAKREARARAW